MNVRFGIALAMLVAGAVGPVAAHHSFSAEFDRNKSVSVTGTVTKVEWLNPHARFYIDVKDDSGTVVNWDFELASPNALMRLGWNRNSLKPGDVVSVTGYGSKTEPHVANANTVKLADGRQVFAGSSIGSTP